MNYEDKIKLHLNSKLILHVTRGFSHLRTLATSAYTKSSCIIGPISNISLLHFTFYILYTHLSPIVDQFSVLRAPSYMCTF